MANADVTPAAPAPQYCPPSVCANHFICARRREALAAIGMPVDLFDGWTGAEGAANYAIMLAVLTEAYEAGQRSVLDRLPPDMLRAA